MNSVLLVLLVVWGAVTAVLILALIYRGTLASHEDTQLFLDPAEKSIVTEQLAVSAKIERMSRLVTVTSILSGALILVIVGLWLWQGLRSF
jgi:hypothetical protein